MLDGRIARLSVLENGSVRSSETSAVGRKFT
jgi:hypothetical protein